MNRPFTRIAGITLAAGALVASSAMTTTAASAAGIYPCPSGYACLYPKLPNPNPPAMYYRYGYYNLHKVYGNHLFMNNQTGGAKAYLCTKTGGNGVCTLVKAGHEVTTNFAPINSIYLSK